MLKLFCAVLCCVVATFAELDMKMDQLSQHLQEEMADVWEMAAVNYSEPVINTTYKASVEFDMRAMGPLYNSTHTVIDVIANKQAYPEGMVSVSDGHVELASPQEEWKLLLSHYAGPTAVLVVALLLAIILPLAGLFWCCCYWCRVGRRRRPFDRKYDACLKGILAIILICLLTLFLFGVVCLFATDSQVESGVQEAPESVRVGIRDVREFLNATQAHARWLLVNNYKELEESLKVLLTGSGLVISMKLGEFSRAVSVTTLNKMVVRLDDVQADLRAVQKLTANLRTNADHLNSGLRRVKNKILQTLKNCDQPKCIALQNKYKVGQLDTEINYNKMLDQYFPTIPDVSDLLNNVTSLIDSNIKKDVGAGQQVFRDIQAGIRRAVQELIPSVQAELSRTGKRLEAVANEITWATGNFSKDLDDQTYIANRMQDFYEQYGPYRRYVGLAAATAPLLITCLMVWGLVCGVCGKRPDVYGASDCCNKGAGSRCLLCGIGVIFVVGGAIALVLAAYFLVGVASQRFFCDPLTEPRDNRLFADVEKFADLEKAIYKERTDPNFNITSVLVDWHANRTLYKSLQLHRVYNLEAIRADISDEISARVASLRPAFPHAGATILRAEAKRKLTQLADTGLSDFDFDKILYALETNMTSLELDALARRLNSTAHSLPQPGFSAERASLLSAADDVQTLLVEILQPMQRYTTDLNETALRLRDELRFNHTSLKTAIEYLMHEATEAETFLNKQGPERLRNMTREYGAVIEFRLKEYLERVVRGAELDVGRCGPLSAALNATRDAACNKILMPTNGYWMALAWCVVLFLPLLMVAQRLARLYLHLDPYPGPLVEAEYLYDAYADRDNVPLANGSKRSTLDIEGKIAEWRERSVPLPSAPPAASPPHSGTQLLLDGDDVVCQLVPPPAALIDDLKTRLDVKDEDNESGIHESDAYKAEKRSGRRGAGGGGGAREAEGGGGSAAGGRVAPGADPAPPPLDAHHARRYNDMAPKLVPCMPDRANECTGKKDPLGTTDLLSTSDLHHTTIPDQPCLAPSYTEDVLDSVGNSTTTCNLNKIRISTTSTTTTTANRYFCLGGFFFVSLVYFLVTLL